MASSRLRVTETARFKEDLDADSLDLVELVMGLEERFDIEVPEDDLEGVTTVGPRSISCFRQSRIVRRESPTEGRGAGATGSR